MMKIAQMFLMAVVAVVLSAGSADAGLFDCLKRDKCCEPVCCEETVCCEEVVVECCEEAPAEEPAPEEPAVEVCCEEAAPTCCEPEPTCCEPEPCCDPCGGKKLFGGGFLSKLRDRGGCDPCGC